MNAIDKELLTVQEFAEIVGIKKQGIYQQIRNENSKLFPYVVFEGKRAYIKKTALEEVYKKGQDSQAQSQEGGQDGQAQSQEGGQDGQAQSQEGGQDSQAQSQAQNIIEFLQEQIRVKDKQLEEKDKVIADVMRLLDQEQHLHAQTRLLLEERNKAQNDEDEEQEEIIQETKNQEPKKKRSFWAWLFGE